MIGHVDHIDQVLDKKLTGCPGQLLLRDLLVHHLQDQRQVRQRWKIDNEMRCREDQAHIKLLRLREATVCGHHHHFATVHSHRFFRVTLGIHSTGPFEDHKFQGRTRRQKSRSARNADGNRCRVNPDRGCFGRHLHKDRAIRQVYLASPCCKTENRVRAEPRDSEISESQFGARFRPCAHCSTQCDFIIHDRGTRRGMWF